MILQGFSKNTREELQCYHCSGSKMVYVKKKKKIRTKICHGVMSKHSVQQKQTKNKQKNINYTID